MTFDDILKEQFIDYTKNSYDSEDVVFGILKNPSIRELRNLIKEEKPSGFRLIVDKKNEDVYVFNNKLLHDYALTKIKSLGNKISDTSSYFGFSDKDFNFEGYRVGGKDRHKIQKELEDITTKKTPFKKIKVVIN